MAMHETPWMKSKIHVDTIEIYLENSNHQIFAMVKFFSLKNKKDDSINKWQLTVESFQTKTIVFPQVSASFICWISS